MKVKGAVFVVGIMLLSALSAFAQDYSKVEIGGGYSYMRFNPTVSSVVSGFSLNGGGGNISVYFNHIIGIEMDLEGYGALTKTFTLPGGNSLCPAGCNVTSSGNLFTYNFGPIFKPLRAQHFELFLEALGGGAHSNTYSNMVKACALNCVTSLAPSNNAWDFVIGGGFDIPVNRTLAIRPAQFDFVMTRFNNAIISNHSNQSNFRYQAGLVLRF
jgi:hypothetical protein